MSNTIVHIENLHLQYGSTTVLQNFVWAYEKGSQWVIGGKSGTGKSTLARAIANHRLYPNIQISLNENNTFTHEVCYVPNWYQFTNLEGDRNFYYQQRYNRHQGNDTLTVGAELRQYGEKEQLSQESLTSIVDTLDMRNQMNAQLIELSSGEHKKLQLIKALWCRPQLLLLDEPYTGLDRSSRKALNNILDTYVEQGGHILLITNDHDVPRSITHFGEVRRDHVASVPSPAHFQLEAHREANRLPAFLLEKPQQFADPIVKLRDVSIKYGDKTVLDRVCWEIKSGERWVLQGPNGSGKSTMLSLITGDHPQAYGHDITLFGNKRGSGESIWEIKQKIGMISPEMHWYFDQNATVWHTIASGFYDSIGWFIDVKFHEKKQIDELMEFFELTEDKDKLLHTLSLGKQRLAMLARTIIKNPPLLILDEPCQGLDHHQTQHFNDVVDDLVDHGKTLIYVGHYESQLPKSIQRRIVLEKGKVILNEHLEEEQHYLAYHQVES